MSGCLLCRSHKELGLVKSAQALQFLEHVRLDSLSVQQLVASLFSGCPGGELSLHSDLGAKLCSLLSDTDLANVEAACKAELARRRMEQQSSDLTKSIELQNGGLKPWALELLIPSAEDTAEIDAVRRVLKLQNLKPLGPAQRPESRAAKLTSFKGDLEPHSAAAAKLVQRWRHSTLKSCTNAQAETEKNEYTEAVALTRKLQRSVILLDHSDRLMVLYEPGFTGNYLDCPAAKLPGSDLLDLADPKLLDQALAVMFAFQDSRSELRSTKVEYAFELREDQELKGGKAKLHAEMFGYLNEIPKSLTLGEFRRQSGKSPAKLSAEILTSKEMTDLRRELADSLMQRQEAADAGGLGHPDRPRSSVLADEVGAAAALRAEAARRRGAPRCGRAVAVR